MQEARNQMPHFHAQEAGAGGLAGLLGAYLYHKGKGWLTKEKFRNPEHERLALLKRLAAGGLIGAGGANLVADRLRRYISNLPSPYQYEKDRIKIMKEEGWKGLWNGAVLDRPLQKDDPSDKQLHTQMRRELLRRGFNVHRDNPTRDHFKVTGRAPDGTSVLGLADRMFDAQHQMKPEFKDVWDALSPVNMYPLKGLEDESRVPYIPGDTGKVQLEYGPLFHMFSMRPFGDALQYYDKWDFDLHDNEKQDLKEITKDLFNKLVHEPRTFLDYLKSETGKPKADKFKTLAMRHLADTTFARNMPAFHQSFHVPGLGTEDIAPLPYRIPLYGEKSK